MTGPTQPAVARQLGRLVNDVARRVSAYRRLWESAGLDAAALQTVTSLEALPVVTRRDLEGFEPAARCSTPAGAAGLALERTGGSTGRPFEVPVDGPTRRRRQRRFLRALAGCGYRPGQRLLLLTTTTSPPRIARPLNWHYVPLSLDEPALAAAYRRIRPAMLYGPLNTLLALASALDASGRQWPRPRSVVSTAEELTPLARRRLAAAYGVDPADFYGMTETGLLAWRPGGAAHYRIASDDLLLEFLPSAADPLLERVVVTDFGKTAMPLVRFDTGDLVRRDGQLPGSPLIGFVGRTVDSLLLPDGRRISPYRVTLAVEAVDGVTQYRVTQRADLSLECTVWVASGAGPAVIASVERRLRSLLDEAVPVTVHAGSTAEAAQRKFRPVQSLAGRQAPVAPAG